MSENLLLDNFLFLHNTEPDSFGVGVESLIHTSRPSSGGRSCLQSHTAIVMSSLHDHCMGTVVIESVSDHESSFGPSIVRGKAFDKACDSDICSTIELNKVKLIPISLYFNNSMIRNRISDTEKWIQVKRKDLPKYHFQHPWQSNFPVRSPLHHLQELAYQYLSDQNSEKVLDGPNEITFKLNKRQVLTKMCRGNRHPDLIKNLKVPNN